MIDFIINSIAMGHAYVFKVKKSRIIIITIFAICSVLGFLIAKDRVAFYRADFIILGILFFGGLCLVGVLFVVGIYAKIKTYPIRKERLTYTDMFNQINFSAFNGSSPDFLGAQETEYFKILTFKSMIPLIEWQKRKDFFETYFNAQIAEINNNVDNNNIVNLCMIKKSLPEILLWNDKYIPTYKERLIIGAGYINYVFLDLNKSAHAFIAGETGSGKSNILKCLIYQCALKGHKIKLIDFKRGVSFSDFDKVVDIYSDYDKIQMFLEELVAETKHRLDLLRESRVESMEQYNRTVPINNQMPRIILFIDELAELIRAGERQASKNITNSLETLTRLSRAAGINVIMGIQRPDAMIINGQIKNNVSLRICGRFVDPEPSRIMLGNDSANKLPKIRGRFIWKDDEQIEFQAFRITSDLMGHLYLLEKKTPSVIHKKENPTEQKSETAETVFNFDDIEI